MRRQRVMMTTIAILRILRAQMIANLPMRMQMQTPMMMQSLQKAK